MMVSAARGKLSQDLSHYRPLHRATGNSDVTFRDSFLGNVDIHQGEWKYAHIASSGPILTVCKLEEVVCNCTLV